jgi:cytochrome c553
MMVRFHMHQNFDLVRAIERLLIRGKLEDARIFATAISIAPDEPAHGPWIAQTIVVRDRAAAVARATDGRDALRKVAALGAACGNCHGEHAVKLGIDRVPRLPPDQPTLDARMARHRWAADRLWEAVIGNVDEAWREGLDVLASTPLEDQDRKGFAQQLKRQADQARRPSPGVLVDRATQYGEILVTCAGCHAAKR